MQRTKINFHAKCKNKSTLTKEAEPKDFTSILKEALVYGDNVGIKEFVIKQITKNNLTCNRHERTSKRI